MSSLATKLLPNAGARELAVRSRAWRQALEGIDADALLIAGTLTDATPSVIAGAFDHAHVLRRGSGGYPCEVQRGVVWLQLVLRTTYTLVPDASIDKLLNRYVRPLSKALTSFAKTPVSYFGRDWISARKQPLGFVGFAHDARTNQAMFEAIVGVTAPIAQGEGDDTTSFAGKAHTTLHALASSEAKPPDPDEVAKRIAFEYAALATSAGGRLIVLDGELLAPSPASEEAGAFAWSATRPEAIGFVGAGASPGGRLRVGGTLMASADAMERLEDAVSALGPGANALAIGEVVDRMLGRDGAHVFGVRKLTSIRDVILEACAAPSA